ncbi:hypothetical protein GGI35DRAFT_62245 [Trichoderma velutinum]
MQPLSYAKSLRATVSEPTDRPSVSRVKKRACINCTASKAKCSPLSSDKCERCHRLGKACRYANLVTTRKKPEKNARLQALERKVEKLLAQQKSDSRESPPPTQPLNDEDGAPFANGGQWAGRTRVPITPGLSGTTSSHTSSTVDGSVERNTADIVERGIFTEEHAKILLDRFRNRGTQNFPFVVIPSHASLYDVRKKSPFLFLAITAIMVFDNPLLQHQLGEELRRQAFERVLTGSERCLDLLQGLLVYTAWYCHFYRAGKREELLLSQLCVTLAHDLDIDKPRVHKEAERLGQCNEATSNGSISSSSTARMRAYLGTYCISSLVASTLRKCTALPYTKYMAHCCRSLAAQKEYDTDDLISPLVRSQELLRRVIDAFSYDDMNTDIILGEFAIVSTADAFMRELNLSRPEVPFSYQKNTLLDLELLGIRIMINEAALHPEFWSHTKGEYQDTNQSHFPVSRIHMLCDSLQTCQEFIRTFLTFSSYDLRYLTVFIYPKLCYVFMTLSKLVFLDSGSNHAKDSGQPEHQASQTSLWEPVHVAAQADFQTLASQVLEKFTAGASSNSYFEGQRNAMSNFVFAMKLLMSRYEQQMNQIRKDWHNTEPLVLPIEIPQDGTAAAPNGNGNVPNIVNMDTAFSWELLASIGWEDSLEFLE